MEKEVFGVIYERFSVGRKLSSFGVKHDIKTVLEMPAHGAKAMPSIYSLGFGTCAQKITLVNGNPKYISEWKKIGAAHKIEWVHEDDILQSSFQDKSYDFVWNFAYLPTCPDPDKLIEEMKRISKNMWLCSRLTQEILVFRSTGLSIKKQGFHGHMEI